MNKKAAGVWTATALTLLSCVTGYAAEWKKDQIGDYFVYDDGSYAANGIKNINGTNYAFNEEGYMLTGWQFLHRVWYYFNPESGAQETGWKQIGGKWYYLDPERQGAMYTGWLDWEGNRYYLDADGVMQTKIFSIESWMDGSEYSYQADDSGALIRNKEEKRGDGSVVRYDENGVMMYRNTLTETVNDLEGGSKWQYVLNNDSMKEQKAENKEVVETAARTLEDELFDNYAVRVSLADGRKKESAYASWEKRARRLLAKYRTEEEIDAYISDVNAKKYERYDDAPVVYEYDGVTYQIIYDNEDDYYQITFEENGRERTYTFGKRYNWD